MELFSKGTHGSQSGIATYYINVGPHESAVACFISDELADLIAASANAFIMAARDMGGTPLERAEAIGGNLADIGKALVWGQKALEQVRELIEDAGHEWPADTWDDTHGLPGHALRLISEALECFPPIKFTQPVDEQAALIKDLMEALELQIAESGPAEDQDTVKALIEKAQKTLGDRCRELGIEPEEIK